MQYLSFHQVLAITRYELMMMWRRGSLRIVAAGLIILPLIYLIAARESFLLAVERNELSGTPVYYLNTTMMFLATMPTLVTLLVAIPIILTEVIPLDRQYHVNSWLRALPLTHRAYLAGKVLGIWVGLIGVLLLACGVLGVAGWLLIGAFDLSMWLLLWSVGLLTFTLFTGALSVLAAAGQPNRRRAVIIGLLLVGVLIFLYVHAPIGNFHMEAIVATYTDITLIFNEGFTRLPPIITLEALIIGTAILLLTGLLAWGWLCWEEYR